MEKRLQTMGEFMPFTRTPASQPTASAAGGTGSPAEVNPTIAGLAGDDRGRLP